jgi:ribose transport system substrate-binding protein
MKKDKWSIIFIVSFLLLLILLAGYVYLSEDKQSDKLINVSVLVYGNENGHWSSLKQGLSQAEKDYKIVFNYVATSLEDSAQEQIEQINREIEHGAQGLMIAVSDSAKLDETVLKLAKKLPIVLIETSVTHTDGIEYLTANNYDMGAALADTLRKDQDSTKRVAVIQANLQRNSVTERMQGFMDKLTDYNISILEPSENGTNQAQLRNLLMNQRPEVVVAFDNNSLESLAYVVAGSKLDIKVYGIGNSDKVVYYLDKEMIQSIVYQNGLSTGYLGGQVLYNKITEESKEIEKEITYNVINKESMYSIENQRLLFPIVQ